MIGIIGAMDEEVAELKEVMLVEETIDYASMVFYKGKLEQQSVVIVRSGIGKVNAAVCAQILIDKFQVKMIINTGVAGSLDAQLDIGDMVISKDALHHDMDTSQFGDPLGMVPRMDVLAFPADKRLIELAQEVNESVNPDIKTYVGRVASGDQFISAAEKKDFIVRTFGAACTEMEGAAIAQVAYLNHISYVIIRAISDKADNSAQEDYPTFLLKAIDHSVRLVKGLLAAL